KNTGKIQGMEVAQLYIGNAKSKIFRAKKELKGFIKVNLLPNETKNVFIPFDDYTFRYWNVKTNKFEVEGGDYEIYINKSVNQTELNGTINIEATTTDLPLQSKILPSYYSGDIKNVSRDEFKSLTGFDIPNPNRVYIKKNRIMVGYNTTVAELRYAKGWTGRFFARMIRFAPKFLRFFGKKQLANTIYMGMYHQPMRGLSRMTNGMVSWGQLDGLVLMFNGKFFKGFRHYLKEGRIKKKIRKQNK
ncbi:MAG: fibronectin type III-like domain-contianing protein, partial [Acholeplasmataceae bacterium]